MFGNHGDQERGHLIMSSFAKVNIGLSEQMGSKRALFLVLNFFPFY